MNQRQQYKLGELVEIKHGFAFEGTGFKESGKYSLLTPKNFFEAGGFRKLNTGQKFYDGSVSSKWVLKPGDVLIALTEQAPGLLGASVRIPNEGVWLHNQRMGLIDIKEPKRLAANYLYHWFNWSPIRQTIFETASGTKVRHSSPSQIHALKIALPTIAEQLQAAVVLDECDIAIHRYGELLTSLELRKQGLMQQLLSGRRRLKGFKGKWQQTRADGLFTEITKRSQTEEPLLSVTQDRGVIPRSMLEARVTMPTGDLAAFKLVEKDNFVISLRSFQGGLEHSEYRGLVSPAYTVLESDASRVHAAYFRQYFKSTDFLRRLSVAVVGIRDGKQINYTDFKSIKLPLPPTAEQIAITEVLHEADIHIALAERQVNQLKAQKRALMQKLLSGQWWLPAKAVKGKK